LNWTCNCNKICIKANERSIIHCSSLHYVHCHFHTFLRIENLSFRSILPQLRAFRCKSFYEWKETHKHSMSVCNMLHCEKYWITAESFSNHFIDFQDWYIILKKWNNMKEGYLNFNIMVSECAVLRKLSINMFRY